MIKYTENQKLQTILSSLERELDIISECLPCMSVWLIDEIASMLLFSGCGKAEYLIAAGRHTAQTSPGDATLDIDFILL